MTRLPFGSCWVTTAATLVVTSSERFTVPVPLDVLAPLLAISASALVPPGRALVMPLPSTPSMPMESLEVRERAVEFSISALSVMRTLTVRMSPMLRARWSLKKVREPDYSEAGA